MLYIDRFVMKTTATGAGFLTFPVIRQGTRSPHLSALLGWTEEASTGGGYRKRKCRVEVL